MATGRVGADATSAAMSGAVVWRRNAFAPPSARRPSSIPGSSTRRTIRPRRGLRASSAIALVDLGGAQVPLAVPADVVARQVEQDLVARDAALDGALDPVQDDLARVGRVKQE